MSEERPGYAHPIGVSVGDMTPPEALGEKARWLEQLGPSQAGSRGHLRPRPPKRPILPPDDHRMRS